MGGCSPSKMPGAGDDRSELDADHQRPTAKFGFSKNHHLSNGSSRNVSESRIKNLAASDPNYEVVKGGRKSPDSDRTVTSNHHAHDFKDAESQTARSHPVNLPAPPEIKFSRPSSFGVLSSRSHSARSQAPLAAMETASELGTPTPMDENKSLRSFLPQPSRLAFAPKEPVKTPLGSNTVGFRPQGPPPKPPTLASRSVQPPSSFGSQGRNGTDNVMISTSPASGIKSPITASQSAVSGLPKPGTLGHASNRAKSLKEADNSRSGNSITNKLPAHTTNPLKTPNNDKLGVVNHHHQQQGDAAASPTFAPNILPVVKLQPPSGKIIRAPTSSTMGNAPRGPLAEQQRLLPAALPVYNPPKPPRISPRNAEKIQPNSLEGNGGKEELASGNENYSNASSAGKPTKLIFSPKRLLSNGDHREEENGYSTSDDLRQIHGIPKDREAMAERDPEYLVDEIFMQGMLNGLGEVKRLAHALLEIDENASQSAKINGSSYRKSAGDYEFANGDCLDLMELLKPPTQAVFNDAKASQELILKLQTALHKMTLEKRF